MKTPPVQRAASRKKLAAKGQALADGSEPIPDLGYLKRAIRSVGRLDPSKRPALARLIRKRAKELGALNAPGVKGTWAFANDGASIELAGGFRFRHGWIPLDDPEASHHMDEARKAHAEGRHGAAINHLTAAIGKTKDKSAAFHLTELRSEMAARAMGKTYKPKPMPKALHALANDSEALEMATMTGKMPKVRGAADVTCTRSGPGSVIVMHTSTGSKVGTLDKGMGGWQATHRTGKKLDPAPTMAASMNGLIGYHNKLAASAPTAGTGSADMASDGPAVDLATPAATSSDGPRVTAMSGGKKATAAPAASMSAEVTKVYKKLIAKGMKPGQAMALAKRAAAMHAKATAA